MKIFVAVFADQAIELGDLVVDLFARDARMMSSLLHNQMRLDISMSWASASSSSARAASHSPVMKPVYPMLLMYWSAHRRVARTPRELEAIAVALLGRDVVDLAKW